MRYAVFAFITAMLMLFPGGAIAEDFQEGENVIVAVDIGGQAQKVSQYPISLGLGVVIDTGGTEHEVKIYDAVCQNPNKCDFYSWKTQWVKESAMIHTPSHDVESNGRRLEKKGIGPDKYNPCQLSCISFNLGDN